MNIILFKAKTLYWFDSKVIDGFVHLISDFTLNMAKISAWFDTHIVDGLVNGAAALVNQIGIWLRSMQSGKLQHYFIWMLMIVLSFMIYKIVI